MAAKKKRRGLGGTAEEHQAEVGPKAKSAKRGLRTASVLAEQGKCRAALESLVGGYQDLAIAMHSSAGRVNDDLDPLLEEQTSYRRKFVQKCLVGGGLSGIKRRSRR